MASNWSLCGVCYSLGVSNRASVWCPDCDEGLCGDCEKRHNVSMGTKSHQAVPVDKYRQLPPEILKITQTCTIHKHKYQIYCQIHDCPCCHRCLIEKHNTCKDIKAIDDIVQNVKSSHAFTKLEESLKELSENLTKTIRHKESNILLLKNEKHQIEKEISDVRVKVNEYLDHLQGTLIKELEVLDGKENGKIRDLITSMKERESAIKELQDTLSQIQVHATDLQVYLAITGLEKDVRKEEELFELLQSTAEVNEETHLKIDFHKTIQHLEKDVKTFGQVGILTQPIKLAFERKKDKQAQLIISNTVTSVKNISLIRRDSFMFGLPPTVISCVLLPSGIAAIVGRSFVENKPKLFGIRPDGRTEFEISLRLDKYDVRDMTYIPSINSLAVLGIGCDTSIQMFDLQTNITKSIQVQGNYHGISYKSENELFLIGDEEINTMNLADKSIQSVKSQQMMGLKSVAFFKENVYYTTERPVSVPAFLARHEETEVHCCNLQGQPVWSFKATTALRNPHSIVVGTNGSVYVAGRDSNNIVVIQSDGSKHAELLSSVDGLESPVGIDYDRTSNQLLVVNSNGKAFLYKVNKQ